MSKIIKNHSSKRKIKVCHIITKMVYGGASLGTLHLVERLDPKYFRRFIICGAQSESEGSLLNNIADREINAIIVPEMVREINPVKDALAFMKLIVLIKKYRYDIVHTHGSKAGVIGRLAAASKRVPVILHTVHGWGLKAGSFTARVLFRFIERILASFTTKILFQTRADLHEASDYKIGKRNQYVLIGNGIDLAPFFKYNKRAAEHIKNTLNVKNKKVVGTVGRVSPQKNPVGFISIAQEVLKKKKNIKFVFIGGGELLAQMKRLVRKMNADQDIIFTGVRDDIPEIVANFDVFVLPSLWEGLPRSLIEAMALSKPVIVHEIGGIQEIVKDGVNGLIVPVNDSKRFAHKLIFLLDNSAYSRDLGKHARITAKDYDFSKVVARTEYLYRNLMQQTAS